MTTAPISAQPDASGRFAFRNLPAGEYVLRLQLIGHAASERAVRVEPGEIVTVELPLAVEAVLVDEIQVTASRARRAVSDVAAPMSVLDRETIESLQPDKVGDLFAREPGIEVDGAGPFLGLPVIRGLSGNRVLVLVDGQRLNNAREAINFGGVQPSLVDVERIEEVEILRGPASVLYGTDALGGIVNIVTDEPPFPTDGLEFGGRLSSSYSSIDEGWSVTGGAHVAAPDISLRVSGTKRDADDFEAPDGEVVNSEAESIDVSADLDLRLAPGHRLGVQLQRFEGEDIGLPGAAGVFSASFPFTDRDKASVEYRGDGIPGLGSLTVEAYVQDQEENFTTVLDLPPIEAGPFNLLVDSRTERVSDVLTVGWGARGETRAGDSHRLTYGIDFFRDEVDEERREETVTVREPTFPGPPPSEETEIDTAPTTPEGSFQGVGVYLQDEIEAGRWRVVPGIRFDRFDIDTERLERPEGDVPAEEIQEEALTGSLGVLFRATDHLKLAVNAGRGFRTPNLIERFFFGPGSQGGLTVPNPDLDDETSLNVDLGFRLRFPSLRASATYFHNRIDDFVTFRAATFEGDSTFGGQPVSQVQNVGEVRLQGVELSAEYLLATAWSRWLLFANASYTDGEDLETDEPLFVPPAKVVVGLRWSDHGERFSALVSARAVDRQDDVPAGFDEVPGFAVFDLRGSLDLAAWVDQDVVLQIGIENLTDKLYREPFNAAFSPGRSFETTLRMGF